MVYIYYNSGTHDEGPPLLRQHFLKPLPEPLLRKPLLDVLGSYANEGISHMTLKMKTSKSSAGGHYHAKFDGGCFESLHKVPTLNFQTNVEMHK